MAASVGLRQRVAALPWSALTADLMERGHALAGPLLGGRECSELARSFDDDSRFRSRVVMERHNFGCGDYAYFADPLPRVVATLREALYPRLASVANDWAAALGRDDHYPETLAAYLAECGAAGQTKPTPLLLRYREEGYNRLHRDRYGALHFPLQGVVMLSRPGVDFEGGEFLLVENRARQQSLGHALRPKQGELVLFAGGDRPAAGARGVLRAAVRHGTSRVHAGERYTLGIIFHNAA